MGTHEGAHIEKDPVISSSSERQSLTGQIDSTLSILKDDTAIDGSLAIDAESDKTRRDKCTYFGTPPSKIKEPT